MLNVRVLSIDSLFTQWKAFSHEAFQGVEETCSKALNISNTGFLNSDKLSDTIMLLKCSPATE